MALLRVGYLTYGLDRKPTGIGRYSVELLRSMHRQSSEVEFVLLTTEGEDRHGLWQQFERHALPGCSRLPVLLSLGNLLLSDAIRRYRLDVVHDPNGIAPFFGPAYGASRIVTLHDAFAFVTPHTHNRLDNWRYRVQLPYAARAATAVVTVSQCSKRDLSHYLHIPDEHIHVIAEGVDTRFSPVADDRRREAVLAKYGIKPPYLLYVGGISARKNIVRLIEAAVLVRRRHPEIRLVLAGSKQWRTASIDRALARADLDDTVYCTGYVDDDDLPSLYSGAEVFVFPSLYEGFGLPPLEAMACGTPVVTSNRSSLPEVVGSAALRVDPLDPRAIADSIMLILDQPHLASELRRQGLERARQFSWAQAGARMLELYMMLAPAPSYASVPQD
ncbi:MAG: glycosyltransferase family 1 protein [Chloroflexota bacterium]|nr:MAG: glycosyltransferase family 1 protein [Chloroflexota bacterium]